MYNVAMTTKHSDTKSPYRESAKGIRISKARAEQEVRKHGCEMADMVADLGDHETYKATDVLDWLGY